MCNIQQLRHYDDDKMFEACAHYPTGYVLTVPFDLLRKGNITSAIHQK